VREHGGQRHVGGGLEAGAGEDDVGVLAAEFEGYLPHRPRGGRHQPAAGLHTTGERDEVRIRMVAERGTRLRACIEDQVAGTRRKPGLRQQPHELDRGARGQLARLEREGAGREGRGDLPGCLQERVVQGMIGPHTPTGSYATRLSTSAQPVSTTRPDSVATSRPK
jgi:hypothetical protein